LQLTEFFYDRPVLFIKTCLLSSLINLYISIDFEDIFRTPEDDFGAISLSNNEEVLPFYPVTTVPHTIASKERAHGTCCTCLNTTAAYIFVPCGHLCICYECQEQLQDHKCPLCRKDYTHCIRAITT